MLKERRVFLYILLGWCLDNEGDFPIFSHVLVVDVRIIKALRGSTFEKLWFENFRSMKLISKICLPIIRVKAVSN